MDKLIKCAIIVPGRFHAFELAKSLIQMGLDLKVLTNYPTFVTRQFQLSDGNVISFPLHGLIHRLAYRYQWAKDGNALDRWLHRAFSRWAAREVTRMQPTVVHAFSGVALELFEHLRLESPQTFKSLTRGSAHIETQHQLLLEEQTRAGVPIELPSAWMIQRERREYQLADNIVTLSSFARESFVEKQVPREKLSLLPLGSNVQRFRPSNAVVVERINRLRTGSRLKILFTGNISLQKGFIDLIAIAEALKDYADIHLVGNVTPDAQALFHRSQQLFQWTPRVPETELPKIYDAADIYLFPTIQDGFAVVLAQAQAACLPILATRNCAAPDMVIEGVTGHLFPIRRPDLFIQRLQAWNLQRDPVVAAVESLWASPSSRDYADVARDFVDILSRRLLSHSQSPTA